MSANETIIADNLQALSGDELAEQYRRLADFYRALKQSHEEELQASHELRRNYQTAAESAAYMTSELESIDSVHREELEKIKDKYNQALSGLKESNGELKQQNSALEATVEVLQKNVDQLRERVEELEFAGQNSESVTGNSTLASEREAMLEKEADELKQLISDQQEKIDTLSLQLVNSDSKLENLREKLECVEDNLSSKKLELEELQTLLESTQEENMRLSSELAALQSAPEDANKKGNSLFAEVDDQRQKMIDMLQAQRKRYMEMKKLHSEDQFKIRRLTRENRELCDEIRSCSDLFVTADVSFRDESAKHIALLGDELKRLREQLAVTERRLLDKAGSTSWVDPFVSFYKNESATLKTQLFQAQMAKRLGEEICYDAQQALAKWRFEALKSRYIIINRETLLEEHGIGFESFDGGSQASIHIDEVMIAKAKPHLTFSMGNSAPATISDLPKLDELDLLADLHIDLKSTSTSKPPAVGGLLLPPPPPPPPLTTVQIPKDPKIKEEVLTPLATPLVTPVQSPKSMKKESTSSNRKPVYRDIVFTPKEGSSATSAKKPTPGPPPKRNEKENVPQVAAGDQTQSQLSLGKSYGWVSEKRTKNNVVIRRFKLPERKNPTADAGHE